MINHYSFGQITIDGQEYDHDVFIDLNGQVHRWWRQESHQVSPEDIKDVFQEKPEILVIGTGAYGVAKVLPAVEILAKQGGIKLIVEPSGSAKEIYNQLKKENRKAAAFFHLTC